MWRLFVIIPTSLMLAIMHVSVIAWVPGIRVAPLLSGALVIILAWSGLFRLALAWVLLAAVWMDLLRGAPVGVLALSIACAGFLAYPFARRYRLEQDSGSLVAIAVIVVTAEVVLAPLIRDGAPRDLLRIIQLLVVWAGGLAWVLLLALILQRVLRRSPSGTAAYAPIDVPRSY